MTLSGLARLAWVDVVDGATPSRISSGTCSRCCRCPR